MTQEDKDLLLKDLCGRLPYRVIGKYSWKGSKSSKRELTSDLMAELFNSFNSTAEDSDFKPYLRPLSSMTKEEYAELRNMTITSPNLETAVVLFREHHYDEEPNWRNEWSFRSLPEVLDWLHVHHFDYRGLIGKGLALEAPEDMYKTE